MTHPTSPNLQLRSCGHQRGAQNRQQTHHSPSCPKNHLKTLRDRTTDCVTARLIRSGNLSQNGYGGGGGGGGGGAVRCGVVWCGVVCFCVFRFALSLHSTSCERPATVGSRLSSHRLPGICWTCTKETSNTSSMDCNWGISVVCSSGPRETAAAPRKGCRRP